ncbi:MAG: hypothetical protein R3E32_23260 [Chitinophagales bacterium]
MNNIQSLEQVMDNLQSRGYVESLAWVGDKLRMGGIMLNPNQVKVIGTYDIEENSFSKVFALTTDAGEQGYLIDLGGKFEKYLLS